MLTTAAVAGVASCFGSASARAESPTPLPTASLDGDKAAVKANVEWPFWDTHEESGLLDVLNSGTWGRTSGGRRATRLGPA